MTSSLVISPGDVYHLIKYWRSSVGFIYSFIFFFQNFWCAFFKVKHIIGHILEMLGPIDMKQKGSVLLRYWVNHVNLIFSLDLWFFKVKFEIALSQEWEGQSIWDVSMRIDHTWPCMAVENCKLLRWADVCDSDRGDFRKSACRRHI